MNLENSRLLNKRKSRIGEKYLTNEGYWVEIIEYFGNKNCTIKFEDTNTVKNVRLINIQKGEVSNLNHRGVCSIGFVGYGKHQKKGQGVSKMGLYDTTML